MKTIQDYINRYHTVAKNLGYTGQSIDVLVQLLAQASYIGEVENATYMLESSLEKCSLINSKIQHCVDRMYSVFRGTCPRVILKIKPTKYLNFKPYEKIIDSQGFSVYYLGYYQVTKNQVKEEIENNFDIIDGSNSIIKEDTNYQISSTTENEELDLLLNDKDYQGNWNYSEATFYPSIDDNDKSSIQIIIGLVSPKRDNDKLTIEKTISTENTYYVDCLSNNLSDDMYVELGTEGDNKLSRKPRTRIFSEHILEHKIFDLTLPGFGSRLYLANFYKDTVGRDSNSVTGITENSKIFAKYFGYSKLEDYNDNELKRLKLKGADLIPFKNSQEFPNQFLNKEGLSEISDGLCYRPEIPRDTIGTIHYKANRDRFVNSIMRSNSDIGTVLEESFPEIIITGGTSYLFDSSNSGKKLSNINLFYIPKNERILLSNSQIDKFKKEKRAYYIITSDINITPGKKYTAVFNIDLELFGKEDSTDLRKTIGKDILESNYKNKFNIVFDSKSIGEIESLISKIPNVKRIKNITIDYSDDTGKIENINPEESDQYYFDIKYTITTSIIIK